MHAQTPFLASASQAFLPKLHNEKGIPVLNTAEANKFKKYTSALSPHNDQKKVAIRNFKLS